MVWWPRELWGPAGRSVAATNQDPTVHRQRLGQRGKCRRLAGPGQSRLSVGATPCLEQRTQLKG
jgi:hypothetical protein